MELLIRLGEYRSGGDALSDQAVALREAQLDFLRQDTSGQSPYAHTCERLAALAT